LRYEGSPLKFKTNLGIATDKGSFAGLINKVGLDFFNFLSEKIQYKPKHLQISR